ncbi:hypothetical protein BD309DRAFT_974862 [Dichomitus squalens]|nr:hypothetical protein BD309DRAFT_974862 [Dichomitus squalens]
MTDPARRTQSLSLHALLRSQALTPRGRSHAAGFSSRTPNACTALRGSRLHRLSARR